MARWLNPTRPSDEVSDITFQDRFYKLDEVSIVIFAAPKSNCIPGFLILDFSGNVEEFSGRLAVVQII